MEEFKIKRETSQLNNDDTLSSDYANQFTDLDHEKMNRLKEKGDEIMNAIDFKTRMEADTEDESCEIDIVEKKQREFEQSQTEENN